MARTPEEEVRILDRASANVVKAVKELTRELMDKGMSQKDILAHIMRENLEDMNRPQMAALIGVLAIHLVLIESMPSVT